jgi:hypothetical protein
MCNDFFENNECKEFCDHREKIVIKDAGNKQEYRVINKKRQEICKIKVDGCLIKNGERCDYLILSCEDKSAFFVELKGHDLQKALQQINSSIDKVNHSPNFLTTPIYLLASLSLPDSCMGERPFAPPDSPLTSNSTRYRRTSTSVIFHWHSTR